MTEQVVGGLLPALHGLKPILTQIRDFLNNGAEVAGGHLKVNPTRNSLALRLYLTGDVLCIDFDPNPPTADIVTLGSKGHVISAVRVSGPNDSLTIEISGVPDPTLTIAD